MSEHTLSQDVRLNDSLERSIMDDALNNGEAVSIVTLSKNAFTFLKRKLVAFGTFMIELNEGLNEARAKSEKFSRSHW